MDEEAITGLVNAQERGDLDASVYMWDGGYWDWMILGLDDRHHSDFSD